MNTTIRGQRYAIWRPEACPCGLVDSTCPIYRGSMDPAPREQSSPVTSVLGVPCVRGEAEIDVGAPPPANMQLDYFLGSPRQARIVNASLPLLATEGRQHSDATRYLPACRQLRNTSIRARK
jgi:hypothetical protein